MKIIGVTGPIGAGKDEVSGYLKKRYDFYEIVVGDLLREMANKKGIETKRENLEKIQSYYRERYGEEYFAKKVIQKIKDLDADDIVVNGIRRPEDFVPLKEKFGDNFKLLLVQAKPKIRFKRLKKRGRPGDPDTFEEFKEQDRNETEKFDMKKTFKKAGYTINNNGRLKELHRKVDGFVKQINPRKS